MENETIMVSAGKPIPEDFMVINDFGLVDIPMISEPRPAFIDETPNPKIDNFMPNTAGDVMQTMTSANAPRTDPNFNPEGVIFTDGVLDYTAQTGFQANTQSNQPLTRSTPTSGATASKTMVETAKEYAVPIALGVLGTGLLCWALMSGKPKSGDKPVSGLGKYEPVQFKR